MRHRLVQVGIVVDDDGILSPHLGDDLLDVRLAGIHPGGAVDDAQSGFDRAGEGDQRDVRVINDVVADNGPFAGDVVEYSCRQTGLTEDLHKVPADDAGDVGRFEDYRIA